MIIILICIVLGILCFLISKDVKKQVKVKPQFSVTVTRENVEIKQRTLGRLPLANIGDYVSSSGGYLNYAYFKVIGINPSTGRKNTRYYNAKTETDAISQATEDGLIEPFSVEVQPWECPTERQLEYAHDLGAKYQDGVCKQDVSAIISRIVDDDEKAPDSGLAMYANDNGFFFSRYIGEHALFSRIIDNANDTEYGMWYAYSVYLMHKGGCFSDPRKLKHYNVLLSCGNMIVSDDKLLKSLRRCRNEYLLYYYQSISKNTQIYKAVYAYLNQHKVI